MKTLHKLMMIPLIVFLLAACKKTNMEVTPLASLRVVNAVTGGKVVKLNSNVRDSCLTYNSKVFGLLAADNSNLYVYPTGDFAKPYYNTTAPIENGGIYSLFLSGNTAKPDVVFLKDGIAPFYTDSLVGIRVINLSSNSTPLDITLVSSATVNQFTGINYLQLTEFKPFPVKAVNVTGSLSFQVKNASGTLLSTYTLPAAPVAGYATVSITLSRFKTLTLVIKGTMGTTTGTDAFGIYAVPNY